MFTYDPDTQLGEVRALLPDIIEADVIFDDETLNVYLRLAGYDSMKATGLALGAAATDHARVESYRKTQGLTVDGSKCAALMLQRAEMMMNGVLSDDEDDLFDIAEMNHNDFAYREIMSNENLRQG